eukprot:2517123-Pyramimonas_sp.AAC.1
MVTGIYLGYAHKAGGMVGPESYVTPLRQLDGLNMETGRTPASKRPITEKSDQVHSNILDGTAPDREPKVPMREADEIAQTTVKHVLIPLSGVPDGPAGQGTRLGSQATQSFDGGGPSTSTPPPPARGEAAPRPQEGDDSDDDGPGGSIVDDVPVVPDGRAPRRDTRPDDGTRQKLGLAHAEYRLDRQSNFSVAQPRSRVPRPRQLLAQTTQ